MIAAAISTIPLLAITWFGENWGNDMRVGYTVYFLPTALGLVAGYVASLAARNSQSGHVNQTIRHVIFGVVALGILLVTFCVWWGGWNIRNAERFRI